MTAARLISSFSTRTAFVRPSSSSAGCLLVQQRRLASDCRVASSFQAPSFATWHRAKSCEAQSWSRLQAASGNSNNSSNNNRKKPKYPRNTNNTNGNRSFSSKSNNNNDNWHVPTSIDIPVEKIDLSFTRSSGAGGQNVNKVNTKVELRFHVLEADWIPLEVRERLYQQQRSKINKKGFLSVTAQEHRTQEKNRRTAVSKLEDMILQAYVRPKQRNMRTGISQASKARNVENKRRRSQVKQSRKAVSSRDW